MSNLAKQGGDLVRLLDQMKPAIAQALPKHISPERIARVALTALRSNSRLAECTPHSFLGALLQSSQLGLEANTPLGHAYLVPYRNNKSGTYTCQLIIGYQGQLDLARRSGMTKAIYAHAVHKGDVFSYEYGLNPGLVHKPCEEPGEMTHVYAVARLTDGEPVFTVLSRAEVEKFRARSRANDDGPWITDYEAMAKKTAIRRLFTWLPKSAEVAAAIAVDEASERDEPQARSFSPEVADILAQVPHVDEPQRATVPEGAPQGRRMSLGTKSKTKGAAAPPQAKEATPSAPAAATTGDAPAEQGPPVDVGQLHELLAQADPAWEPDECGRIIDGWSEEQRRSALSWAAAVAMDGPMAIQSNRPPHTVLPAMRQPGEEG